ncbi:extracellular solute-binding protein [Microbacterium sp. Y-01]|uniref:ABC transporter substrate-binding protein n=1 Tax=Microbacterium sp. Y-01 TaxID=2048898 RepID=UPI0019D1AF55|nr:extracellular solute-binding protein [Microbacterium sp. Y-01]
MLAGALAGCSSGDDDSTTITFLNTKSEATDFFAQAVADFEADHPDIDVVLDQAADADDGFTRLRSLISKGDAPELVAGLGSTDMAELSQQGVFADLSGFDVIDDIDPAALELVNELGRKDTEQNTIPFSISTTGILYNAEVFDKLGVEVPQTWDELIAAADVFQAAGITPVVGTFADGWTLQFAFNALSGQLQPEDFFASIADGVAADGGQPSFTADYEEVADKFVQLFSYAQGSAVNTDYNSGNAMIANGEAAMLVQGPWAVAPIREVNPDVDLGSFPFPGTDDPDRNGLVASSDLSLALSADAAENAAATEFLDYLMSPEVVNGYNEDAGYYSPRIDAPVSEDPALSGLHEAYAAGNYFTQTISLIPSAIEISNYLQSLAVDKDTSAFLTTLDEQWNLVADRS